MKMLRGLLASVNCSCEMPTAAMSPNMTQKRPETMACGMDANRPPNLPAQSSLSNIDVKSSGGS